jgi:hypothetical protein
LQLCGGVGKNSAKEEKPATQAAADAQQKETG